MRYLEAFSMYENACMSRAGFLRLIKYELVEKRAGYENRRCSSPMNTIAMKY